MHRAFLLCSCILLAVVAAVPVQQVGPAAVWQPTDASWQKLRQECPLDSKYADCLQSKLEAAAPPAAASFIKWLNVQTNNLGWLTGFRKAGGVVGVAYVMYPLRANENSEWVLVNGQPPAIDVDNLQALPTADMEKNAAYIAIKQQAPDVTLFPGDRGQSGPAVQNLQGNAVRLVVPYKLLKGCHACAVLGTAHFSFDFSSDGKLVGIRFVNVQQQATAAGDGVVSRLMSGDQLSVFSRA